MPVTSRRRANQRMRSPPENPARIGLDPEDSSDYSRLLLKKTEADTMEPVTIKSTSTPATVLVRYLGVVSVAVASLLVLLASAGISRAAEREFEAFDHSNFDRPTNIDNPWMPLRPGMRLVYEGTAVDDEGEEEALRVEIHVTDLTKVIDGVRSVVSWDLDYADGELVEAELAFFAQDNGGNVWRMGEHPEEYEDGKFVEALTWLAGFKGAKAGLSMQANPRPGTPSYSQGWAPAVGFTDRGKVDQMGQKIRVPAGSFEDVLVISESSGEEGPDAEQLKYFARGVGNIKVGWRGEGEKTQEVLELIKIKTLGPEDLAEVRAKALELEKHAYEVSKDVYAHTQPAEPSGKTIAHGSPQSQRPQDTESGHTAQVRKVSDEQAKAIAVQTVPGEVIDVAIERKLGKKTIVVEVIADADGAETDVIIDMETGNVLATEK